MNLTGIESAGCIEERVIVTLHVPHIFYIGVLAVRAEVIDDCVACNAVKPRGECTFAFIVGADVLKRFEKRLARQVLSGHAFHRSIKDERVNPFEVTRVQRVEILEGTVFTEERELRIGLHAANNEEKDR